MKGRNCIFGRMLFKHLVFILRWLIVQWKLDRFEEVLSAGVILQTKKANQYLASLKKYSVYYFTRAKPNPDA